MARPTIPITVIWASDLNYSTGPLLLQGTATKIPRAAAQYDEGWVGDEVPPAQEENDGFNGVTTWSRWVGQGSFAGAEDDHIVETDSDGITSIARLNVLGQSAIGGPSLSVLGSTAGAAVDFGNTNGNFTCIITNNSGLAGLRSTQTGTGPALEGLALGTNNDGVRGSGAGTGIGVTGDGGASGHGGEFTGGGSAGHGVVGIGDAVASAGVRGEANADATSFAVEGIATHIDQATIIGRTFGGATASAKAIHGLAGSDAAGVHGDASDGYGVVAESDLTAPKRASFRWVPQDTNPSTALNGDAFFKGTENRPRFRADGNWREIWSTVGGFTSGRGADVSGSRNNGAFGTELTVTLAAPNEPSSTGTVVVRVSGRFRNTAGNLNTVELRVVDTTAAANLPNDVAVRLFQTNALVVTDVANAFEREISFAKNYTLPAAGARSFDLQVRTIGGATGVDWEDLHMEITGVY